MSDDKNEEPTDKKRRDARDKGQIAVSRDLARVVSLAVVAELALKSEPWWRGSINKLIDLSLSGIGRPFPEALAASAQAAGLLLLLVFGVFLVLCSALAFVTFWGQFGILISPETIVPNLDKLNPTNGVKQLFSKKKLGELLMSVGKAAVIGAMIYQLVRAQLPAIVALAGGTPQDVYFGFIELLNGVLKIVIILCVGLGVIDLALQKHFLTKSLMMDLEEIKREYKSQEGDPMVKQQRKQIAQQLAQEEPVARTGQANAVVVNPTHFAVAMYFDGATTPVPMVLAKGRDATAQAMIARARACGIPVIRHVWLARTLYATCRADSYVPPASYAAVAHVYAVVQELMASRRVGLELELERYGEPPAPL
jgi:type III secretion protein U